MTLRERWTFLCISLGYICWVTYWAQQTGHIHLLGDGRLFFEPFDARGYRDFALFLGSFGATPRPDASVLSVRPFLYPLLLSAYSRIGVAGFQIAQVLVSAATVGLLHRVVRRHAGSTLALFAAALLAITPTFAFIPFHALAETIALFLTVVLLNALPLRTSGPPQEVSFAPAFLLALLVATKGIFLPVWLGICLVTILVAYRQRVRNLFWRVTASSSPIIAQLLLSALLLGHPSLSSAASDNLQDRFFPAVYGQAEFGKPMVYVDQRVQNARAQFPSISAELGYLFTHPVASLTTFSKLLIRQNITAQSQFVLMTVKPTAEVRRTQGHVFNFALKLNVAFLCIHAIFCALTLATTAIYWKRKEGPRLLALYAFACSLILPSALVDNQGDRIVVAAEPVWLLTYSLVAYLLWNAWAKRFRVDSQIGSISKLD